ncbi:MAG TPA: TIGR03560 family F420-dependent LLM class oxidoreductase [Baekduia sp.]|uniref:TIGR03560 family F420-dependent LLM class oxidoreductase n=1 Tax=Baekduia sp. TaxID=2600305 RepID=UPI002B78041D|nr:TIGR03560 family F420-dependent LLM class oxidoreductase [Baekduia sp.]HMJ36207.1 TIGR03560 family F420-dependent LLM class oxidoreductase [Baekduia sp.]
MLPAPIRAGLQIPNFNLPGVEPAGLLDALTGIARTAETSGFDSVYVMDHLHQIRGVGPEENWMLEGNTALAALAARTQTAHLGLMVGAVTYRNPALAAKITTTIDVLSGGRAIHSLGAAWFEGEHRAYGFDFPPLGERFERLEDALNISRAMFTQERATYHGKHHSVEQAYNNPRPIRGDIPILVGGSGERKTLRMVAQYADASNVFGEPDHIRHLMDVLAKHCEDVGRDPAEITKTKLGTLVIADTHEAAEKKVAPLRDAMAERFDAVVLWGDRDEVGEQIVANLDAGLDGLIVNMPEVHDLEAVALAGEVLGAATRR